MISSAKREPATGALKATATPAATPAARRVRISRPDSFMSRPKVPANPAPMMTTGPSRPAEPPVPMVTVDRMKIPSASRNPTKGRPKAAP